MKQTLEITDSARKIMIAKKTKNDKKSREVVSVTEKKKSRGRPKKYATLEEAYSANAENSRERGEKILREGKDITPLQKMEDVERREVCREDFMRFCTTFFVKNTVAGQSVHRAKWRRRGVFGERG